MGYSIKGLLLLLCFTFSCVSFAQTLSCSDFKEGTFYAEATDPFKAKYKIERKGNHQVETPLEVPQEFLDAGESMEPYDVNIEWINDCTYKLTVDKEEGDLTELEKEMNEVEVLTELIKIEGNCFYYKTSTTFQNETLVIKGKICKEAF
ncbi:MAG: hypothetical protein Aureis2KO_27960 [Aureisphaera sp.]